MPSLEPGRLGPRRLTLGPGGEAGGRRLKESLKGLRENRVESVAAPGFTKRPLEGAVCRGLPRVFRLCSGAGAELRLSGYVFPQLLSDWR